MTSRETEIGTTIFWSEKLGIPEIEFDCISHFLDESQWYEATDAWGKNCIVIGFRDFVDSPCPRPKMKTRDGFGGQIWVYYPHDGSIAGIEPDKLT